MLCYVPWKKKKPYSDLWDMHVDPPEQNMDVISARVVCLFVWTFLARHCHLQSSPQTVLSTMGGKVFYNVMTHDTVKCPPTQILGWNVPSIWHTLSGLKP